LEGSPVACQHPGCGQGKRNPCELEGLYVLVQEVHACGAIQVHAFLIRV